MISIFPDLSTSVYGNEFRCKNTISADNIFYIFLYIFMAYHNSDILERVNFHDIEGPTRSIFFYGLWSRAEYTQVALVSEISDAEDSICGALP